MSSIKEKLRPPKVPESRLPKVPQCSMLTYQALFEKFFAYLVGVEHMERDVAKIKADRTFTMLTLSNIEYLDLEQWVSERVENNPSADRKTVAEALNVFIKSKGIIRLFLKEEFLKQCVEHFCSM